MIAASENACASRWPRPAQSTSSGTMITPPPTPSRPESAPPMMPMPTSWGQVSERSSGTAGTVSLDAGGPTADDRALMLLLRVFGDPDRLDGVATALESAGGAHHVIRTP